MVSRPALPVSPSVLLAEAVPLWGAKRLSCGMGVLLGTPTVGITQIYPHKVPWAWLRAQSCIFVGQWWGFWGRRWVFCGVLGFFFLLPPPFQPALHPIPCHYLTAGPRDKASSI